MRSPLTTFAGLLDRSVREIAALAADARTFDIERIGRIADIWDNNTVPLVSASGALWPLRTWRARAGLRWMADFSAARRALMVDLDATLDDMVPAAAPERWAYRDYRGRVRPGVFPLTGDIAAGLDADYDLPGASVRSLAVGAAATGVKVRVTLAAARRFTPGTGHVTRNQVGDPALLRFNFVGVTTLRFDADDRCGVTVITDADPATRVRGRAPTRAAQSLESHDRLARPDPRP